MGLLAISPEKRRGGLFAGRRWSPSDSKTKVVSGSRSQLTFSTIRLTGHLDYRRVTLGSWDESMVEQLSESHFSVCYRFHSRSRYFFRPRSLSFSKRKHHGSHVFCKCGLSSPHLREDSSLNLFRFSGTCGTLVADACGFRRSDRNRRNNYQHSLVTGCHSVVWTNDYCWCTGCPPASSA
jgi:hypothetical protein